MKVFAFCAAAFAAAVVIYACSGSSGSILGAAFDAGTDSGAGMQDVTPETGRDAGTDSAADAGVDASGDADAGPVVACELEGGDGTGASGSCTFDVFDDSRIACGRRIRVDCQPIGSFTGTPDAAIPALAGCVEVDGGGIFMFAWFYSCPYPSPCMRRPSADSNCTTFDAGPLAWQCAPALDGGRGAPPSAACTEDDNVAYSGYCCP